MWVMFNNGFISAVQDRDNNDNVMVRARRQKDLEAIFPDRVADIFRVPNSDYECRIRISKVDFAKVVSDRILNNIDYPNFKDSVKDEPLKQFYTDVWWAGLELQPSSIYNTWYNYTNSSGYDLNVGYDDQNWEPKKFYQKY
jgi:hypothetical protein